MQSAEMPVASYEELFGGDEEAEEEQTDVEQEEEPAAGEVAVPEGPPGKKLWSCMRLITICCNSRDCFFYIACIGCICPVIMRLFHYFHA